MPQIQVDQRNIIVLYLVKIIKAKDSRFQGSVVMTLEKHWSKSGDRLRARMLFITFFTELFLYYNTFFNLYILEKKNPLTFPDVAVTAMPVTNCIYSFSFSSGYGCR